MNAHDQHQDVDEAYGRLASSLAPPVDLMTRVEDRIRTRRRRRVAGVGVTAAVVLGGAALVGLGVGGDDGPPVAVDPPPASGLTITLEDGSPYTFTDVTVTCRRYAGTQVIEAFDPGAVDGVGRDETLVDPVLTFSAALDVVADGAIFDLGAPQVRSNEMSLFFALPGGDDANELSSAEDGASGTVEVVSASCGETPHLELRVDAVLGSEVDQAPVPISGYLDE